MAVNGACFFAGFPTTVRCAGPASSGKFKPGPSVADATRRFAVSTEESITAETTTGFAENGRLKKKVVEGEKINPYVLELEKTELEYESSRKSMNDYLEESKNFSKSNDGGGVCGPPRWFSPLDCGSRLDNSPLLLYLPGIDWQLQCLDLSYCFADRTEADGEVGQQEPHHVGIVPKFPGWLYYYFGKPIETEGRKQELRDREEAHELYLHVKSEVENCIAFLKEKRESEPYRNILTRLAYQASHGFDAEVPTFEI